MHYLDIVKGNNVLEFPKLSSKSSTIQLVERPDVPSAPNLRADLSDHLSLVDDKNPLPWLPMGCCDGQDGELECETKSDIDEMPCSYIAELHEGCI